METGYREGYTQGIADGLSKVNIQYTYHQHTGSSSSKGGCYTTPVYHSHTSSCYSICGGLNQAIEKGVQQSNGTWKAMQKCTRCGTTSYDIGSVQHKVGQDLGTCSVQKLTCTKGSNITGYSLGCGKTTSTIESATIIY